MPLLTKFKIICELLNSSDKKKLFLIFCISMLNGLVNAASIASALPFIGIITDPSMMESSRYVLMLREFTGIQSYGGVVIALGLISLLLLIVGNTIAAFDAWYGELFGSRKDQVLSTRLLENYLGLDVLAFERKKSAERAKQIISDVYRVVISTMFSLLDLISEIIVSAFVVIRLLWIDWMVTVIVFAVLVSIHYAINSVTSRRLAKLGKRHAELESSIYSHVLEALKLNKEIKLNGLSSFFVGRYFKSSGEMVKNGLRRSLTSDLPQHVLEIAAFGILLCVAIYFAVFAESGGRSVTIIGMYAAAAYRLVPSMEHIFNKIEEISFDSAILDEMADALQPMEEDEEALKPVPVPEKSIVLQEVSFAYAEDSPFHIEDLHLEFPANRFTCIKGRTGCGKSTVMNLLAGLYRPGKGAIVVDGTPVKAYESRIWKSRIGMVPPAVNLIQATLYENIALGVEQENLERERIHDICRLLDLDELVSGLRHGYETVYGEDALNFSSGQIQKVGMARALYRSPALLLLDESTNAFDLETEKIILDRLKSIEGLTIIFISHRPSVMEHADHLIDLQALMQGTEPGII